MRLPGCDSSSCHPSLRYCPLPPPLPATLLSLLAVQSHSTPLTYTTNHLQHLEDQGRQQQPGQQHNNDQAAATQGKDRRRTATIGCSVGHRTRATTGAHEGDTRTATDDSTQRQRATTTSNESSTIQQQQPFQLSH